MAWYYILCIACIALILVKSVLSWIFGETDVDYVVISVQNMRSVFEITDMLLEKGFKRAFHRDV